MKIKTRFAPSPTGYLHIGGVRTALFSWLYARRQGGQFLLRIEDTDSERSTQDSIDAIVEGMAWLGLDIDEGPIHQTDRLKRYAEVRQQLLDNDSAYLCYCTREELDELRQSQLARKQNPQYDGRCRNRTEARPGIEPVTRFKNPREGEVEVTDLIRGRVVFRNAELDDLIIVRSDDGLPTYNFSVVVDDADMAVSHVIRGDDHLNNTPRQINILRALGIEPPSYAHVPMILGADGGRLSKRHGAVSVLHYRDHGYLPEALLNYLVRLGWSHGDQEIFTLDEMVSLFDLQDVNASASTFNPDKLDWLNQQYIIAADPEYLGTLLAAQYDRLGVDITRGPAVATVAGAMQQRARTLRDMAQDTRYCYEDFEDFDSKAARKALRPVALQPLEAARTALGSLGDWNANAIDEAVRKAADELGLKLGKLGQPLRVAATGGAVSPPIDVILTLIGRDRVLARVDRAIEYVKRRAAEA